MLTSSTVCPTIQAGNYSCQVPIEEIGSLLTNRQEVHKCCVVRGVTSSRCAGVVSSSRQAVHMDC